MAKNTSNSMAVRVRSMLERYPPFHLIPAEELLAIAASVEIRYAPAGQVIFRQEEPPGDHFFFIAEGAINLFHIGAGQTQLIDQCDEGDCFGLRPLLAEASYALTAKAAEATLLYAIPIAVFRPILQAHRAVAAFLDGALVATSRSREVIRRGLFIDQPPLIDSHFHLVEVQGMDYSREPVTCTADTPLRTAAGIMTRESVSSIIVVDQERRPVGILTDKDLRREVATGKTSLDAPARAIMSAPVKTAGPGLTVADVQMEMVKHRIHHLVLTADGTDQSPVIGVLTEHDLLVVQGNNPAVWLRHIRRAQETATLRKVREQAETLLRKYLYQEVAIDYISSVMTEINDALIRRCLELSETELQESGHSNPGVAFCWLALGSEGRKEQLLRTDQDSALVFAEVPPGRLENVRSYFLELAKRTTVKLRECGFAFCPAEMMASNPSWCCSLSEWKKQFGRWIHEPTSEAVMFCTIFFDFRPVYGDPALSEALTDFIFLALKKESKFLSFLAKDAVQNPPPLTFFRNFMVERSGEHRHEFDVKARAMMPLADAARVLTLSSHIRQVTNTFRRFEELAKKEPANREIFTQAAEAYEMLMRYRALQGLQRGDSGRYFNPEDLTKMERLNLRNCFRPIRELQALLTTRFNLVYLM